MWQEWFKASLGMFETFCVNRGRNSEYRDVRSRKKLEMRFLNILRHCPSFSNFFENTGGGTLNFGIYVEKGCVFENKWEKNPNLNIRLVRFGSENWNVKRYLLTENKMIHKFTKLITVYGSLKYCTRWVKCEGILMWLYDPDHGVMRIVCIQVWDNFLTLY